MLHKTTPEAVKIARDNGTEVGLYTNGVPIKDKDIGKLIDNLTFLRFSVNGCSPESHYQIHRGKKEDFNIIRENIKNCVEYKHKSDSNCTIGVYTVLFKQNISELKQWAEDLKNIGLDYFLLKPVSAGMGQTEFIRPVDIGNAKETLESISDLNSDSFNVTIRTDLFCEGYNRKYDRCFGLPFMAAVDADGSVYACNWFWGKEDFKYGNLNEQTFPEIWESQRKKDIVQKIESEFFDMSECCGSCKQNSINSLLWQLKNPPQHLNFL